VLKARDLHVSKTGKDDWLAIMALPGTTSVSEIVLLSGTRSSGLFIPNIGRTSVGGSSLEPSAHIALAFVRNLNPWGSHTSFAMPAAFHATASPFGHFMIALGSQSEISGNRITKMRHIDMPII